MKKIIISCFALLLFVSTYGQIGIDTPSSFNRDDAFNKADYAFEGVIIKTSFYERNHSDVLSDIVKVTKVYKGNLKLGTVEIVNYTNLLSTSVGKDGKDTYAPNLLDDHKLDTLSTFGIFFCKVDKDLPYDATLNTDITDNKVLLSDYHNEFYLGILDRTFCTGKAYFGALGELSSKAEVYQKLRKYPNLKIPDYADQDREFFEDTTIKPLPSDHQYSKHELDSLVRAYTPDAFDSTGKLIDYNHRNKKAKIDTIKTEQTLKKSPDRRARIVLGKP